MHVCSNSAVRMYWMSVCPCSCVFGSDFQQICIVEIEILSFVSNLLCLMLQLMLNFTTFIRVSTPYFCHSRENFVFDSRLRALYNKKLLWVKSNLWSSQDKTIEFYSYSEYLFMWKMFYPVQRFTPIVSMSAMFWQLFVYIFSHQATYLIYIYIHIYIYTYIYIYIHMYIYTYIGCQAWQKFFVDASLLYSQTILVISLTRK